MQIELLGCTNAGKSTLSKSIIETGRVRGVDVSLGEDFLLRQIHLSRIKWHVPRTLLVDLLSLFGCVLASRRNWKLYCFVMHAFLQMPREVPWFERLNCLRNVLKKLGINELVRRRAGPDQIVLLDEGTLHNAHQLFVHVFLTPNPTDIDTFVRLVPVPDIAIYLRADEHVLIERTLKVGHKRIGRHPHDALVGFIKNAVFTFERMRRAESLKNRLLVINDNGDITQSPRSVTQSTTGIAIAVVQAAVKHTYLKSPPATDARG